jgi:hypothetical protein
LEKAVEDLRITPGIHPRILNRILIRKFESQPVLRKTESGGRKRAKKYRRTSLWIIISRGNGVRAGRGVINVERGGDVARI